MNLKCFFGFHDWVIFQPTTYQLKYRECMRCRRRDHWFEIEGIRGHWFNPNSTRSYYLGLASIVVSVFVMVLAIHRLDMKPEKPCLPPMQSMPTSSTQPVRCETP